MKGILKKALAGLKICLSVLPITFTIAGLAAIITGITGLIVNENRSKDAFRNSDVFIEQKAEDLEYINQALADGIMTEKQYNEQLENFNSDEYLEGKLEDPRAFEYKEQVKNSTMPYAITALSGVVAGGAGGIFWFIADGNGWQEDLRDSASDDWNWAKREKKRKEEESDTVEIKY